MTPHNVKSNMHVTSIDVKPLSPVKDRLAKANATRRVDHHRNEKWWFAAVPGAIFHHQDVVCGSNAMRRQALPRGCWLDPTNMSRARSTTHHIHKSGIVITVTCTHSHGSPPHEGIGGAHCHA